MGPYKRLADLDFADDISAISHTLAGIQGITNDIEIFGAKIGLRINCDNTKAMKTGVSSILPSSSCNITRITSISSISGKLHVKRRRFRAGRTRQDLKSCIHFTTASSSTINLNVKLRLYTTIVIPTAIWHIVARPCYK